VRTTLDLDEDLILVARQLAEQRHSTMGQIVSSLMREALKPRETPLMRNGVPLFKTVADAPKPSLALVNRLRDEA
jgi:hypothetical protein